MDISLRIKALRAELNFSQSELGDVIGLTQGKVSDLENGRKVVFTTDLLIRLAAALNTTVEYLVEGTGDRQVKSEAEMQELVKNKQAMIAKMSKEEMADRIEHVEKKYEQVISQLADLVKNEMK